MINQEVLKITVELKEILPWFGVVSTLLNGFFLIKINPISNRQDLQDEKLNNLGERVGKIENVIEEFQKSTTKLAVIEERHKTTDLKIDRVERKLDDLLERKK